MGKDGKRSTPQTVGTFNEAFKQARESGVKTFNWQGKTYNTKTLEEVKEDTSTKKTKTDTGSSAYMTPKYRAGGMINRFKGGGIIQHD